MCKGSDQIPFLSVLLAVQTISERQQSKCLVQILSVNSTGVLVDFDGDDEAPQTP